MSSGESQPTPTTRCIKCNYSLAGTEPGAKCPECGKRSPIHDAHLAETLDAFCFCTNCGYHLFGINRTDNCPECGQHAAQSAIEQSLYRSGATYLHNLRRGYRSVQIGLILILLPLAIVAAGQPVLRFVAQGTGFFSGPPGGFVFSGLILAVVLVAGSVVLLSGAITATTQDPHLGGYASTHRARGVTRAMAILNFCLYIPGLFCIPIFVATIGAITSGMALLAAPALYFAAAATALIASATYSEQLAKRLGTKQVVGTSYRCRNTIVGLVVIMAASGLISLLSVTIAQSHFLYMTSGAAFLVSSLGCLAVYLLLVSSLAKHLKLALKRGEAIPRTLLKPGETNAPS